MARRLIQQRMYYVSAAPRGPTAAEPVTPSPYTWGQVTGGPTDLRGRLATSALTTELASTR